MSAKLSKKLKNAKFRIIACTACGNHLILRVDGKPSLCVVAWFCHWRADPGSHGANWDARDPASYSPITSQKALLTSIL